jgi:hypothetical protein
MPIAPRYEFRLLIPIPKYILSDECKALVFVSDAHLRLSCAITIQIVLFVMDDTARPDN